MASPVQWTLTPAHVASVWAPMTAIMDFSSGFNRASSGFASSVYSLDVHLVQVAMVGLLAIV